MLEKLRIYVKLAFNLTPFNQINSEWNTERTRGSVGCVWLFAAPWTADRQAPLSSTMFHNLLRFETTESVMLSNHLILCCPLLLLPSIFPGSGSFPMSWLFTSNGQSIGTSASASVLPMNIQNWSPLELTALISLRSKGFSSIFSSTTVWKNQFFSTQSSLWSNSHICTQLLKKPSLWLYGYLSAKWCLCFLICCLGLS